MPSRGGFRCNGPNNSFRGLFDDALRLAFLTIPHPFINDGGTEYPNLLFPGFGIDLFRPGPWPFLGFRVQESFLVKAPAGKKILGGDSLCLQGVPAPLFPGPGLSSTEGDVPDFRPDGEVFSGLSSTEGDVPDFRPDGEVFSGLSSCSSFRSDFKASLLSQGELTPRSVRWPSEGP